MQLRYTDKNISITGALVGLINTYVFRANSLFDPDATAGGHQPIGYDQLMPFFERYCVIGMRFRIAFTNSSTTQSSLVGYQVNDAASLSNGATWSTSIEQGQSQWAVVNNINSGQSTKYFTGYVNCPKVMGQTMAAYLADDSNQAIATNNPTDQIYFSLYAGDLTGGTAATCYIQVDLLYDVMFMGSNQLPPS